VSASSKRSLDATHSRVVAAEAPAPALLHRHAAGGTVVAGIGFAIAAYLLFSVQDAGVKWLVAGFPVPEVMAMRSAVILPFCVAFAGPQVVRRAVVSPIRLQLLLRSLVLVAAWVCYYTASRSLQLAELTTIYFSSPLIVTVLAMPLLKERVTKARWASLAIGFAGIVIACRPHDLGHAAPIALAFAAALLWAYTTVLIRQVVQAESTAVLLFVSNVAIVVVCGLAMPFLWRQPSWSEFGLMALVAVFGAAGQFMSMEGIRRAPASVVAPISFSSLIWAFCFGYAVWGDVPDVAVFVGAGLILLSGAVVAAAEWRANREQRRPPATALRQG
jgi:drug/metabolite transporter (DMT)-like permease